MQLRAISYQWGKGRENEDFSAVYESVFAGEGADWFQKSTASMVLLLRYLEDNIEAPPCWALTSHSSCIFYDKDFVQYSHSEDGEGRKMVVNTYALDNGYVLEIPIHFRSSYASVKIHTDDLVSTADLVGEILRGEIDFTVTYK